MKLNKTDRLIVFDKYGGKCAYCGCDLEKGWHVDHIEPIKRNYYYNRHKRKWMSRGSCENPNDDMSNFNPSCPSCNRMKSSFTLKQFRELIGGFINSLNSYHPQYRFVKKYGLVEETNKPVVFYYEKYEQNFLEKK